MHVRKILLGSFLKNVDIWMMKSHNRNRSRAISCNHHATGPRSQVLLPLLADLDRRRLTLPGGRRVSCVGIADGACGFRVQACMTSKKSASICDSLKKCWLACVFCWCCWCCCARCCCAGKGIEGEMLFCWSSQKAL